MIKMSRKAKKAMAVALTAGMLASTAATPVMAATQGWKQNSKGWWYQNADGSYPANKWEKINGKWYYFNANGYMLENSWVKDSQGKWYFVGSNGAMLTNSWAKDKAGLWYWLTDDGSMFEGGWAKIKNDWYFFKNDGVMQSGVITVDGKTYYMGASTDGAMKTGEVNVKGTDYTFDKVNGDCTSEKAPAADKHFDKTGKEIIPEVEVEAVAGITGKITNAITDYAEYGDVLIAGSDAYLKVLVTDAKGQPVAGTAVSLTKKQKSGTDGFEIKGLPVQQTDAYGYATFVIGAKEGKVYNGYESVEVEPTSGHRALISLTATVVATNQTYETDLAFASINPGSADVLNNNWDDDDLLEKPAINSEYDDIVAVTTTIGGKKPIEYVYTQQVSDKGSNNNRVEIELNPQILIPIVGMDDVVSEYQLDVNKEIKEYSVYQNGGNTSFVIEKIAAGLEYADLNFSSIDLSQYTKVEIKTYWAGHANDDRYLIKTYELDGPHTQKDFAYQLPVQPDGEIDVVVKIISEGQVNDDQNAGLVIKDVTGLYAVKDDTDTAYVSLGDCVTWTKVSNKYSEAKELKRDDALLLIPAGSDKKYTAEKNTYSYQVPVYPYTGNAILTVKDANKKIVGYFTIPTENIKKDGDTQNENDIVKYTGAAILVSKDEAFNEVGSIEKKGNKVVVNSEETGITALQAKIELPGFEDEMDLTNNTIYTSVQWSPLPKDVETNSEFYALVGQNVTVKAQLIDKNGNAVSADDQPITFKYSDGSISKEGAIKNTYVSAIHVDPTTDDNGQAILRLNSGDELALLESLSADSKDYDVKLTIGDQTVSKADLRWVETGLSFTSDIAEWKDVNGNPEDGAEKQVNENYVNVNTFKTLSATEEKTLANVLAKDTGSNWIFGYQVIGRTQSDEVDTSADREVVSIEGLKVNLLKSEDGDMVTDGMDNGTVKLTSKKNGATLLTGKINETSVVSGTDVVFNVKIGDDVKQFKNVGEGTPAVDASLDLPITWGIVGEQLSLVSPKGSSFVVKNNDKVYVKLADEFGNPIAGKTVECTITYTKTSGTPEEVKLTGADAVTDEHGLLDITLNADADVKSATITAKYNNVTLAENNVINYKTTDGTTVDFALANANYVFTKNSNPTVELTFTTPINATSLTKDMFTITGTEGKVVVDKVTVDKNDNKKVILTLADIHANGLTGAAYTVSVASKTVEGVEYDLCDTNGNSIGNDSVKFSLTSQATKLESSINSTSEITVTIDNLVPGAQAVVVYDGGNGYVTSPSLTDGVATVAPSGNVVTITLNPGVEVKGKITVYYNGGSVVISKETLIAKVVATNKLALTTALATPPATVTADSNVSWVQDSNYTVSNVSVEEVDPEAPIFEEIASATPTTLTTKNTLPADAAAIVKVVYKHKVYTTETVTVTYNVESDGNNVTFELPEA